MMIAAVVVALTMAAAAPADVKGKWEGTITGERPDGTTNEDTALLILDQKDTTISGTIGGSETDQHPITSGTIEGNKITLTAKNANNDREYRLELTLDKDQMNGTMAMGERRAKLALKRRKQ
jgi:hypothetical protein